MYEVKLENIFEGPMDLLVFLIKKNEVDIYDIPIALITDQYLEYLEWMKTMNINFAGDFIVMAATLAQIKSRMLLPAHENQGDEEDDPRLEIARPLLEYLQMKSVAEQLAQRHLLGEKVFPRSPTKEDLLTAPRDEMISVDLFELIDAFRRILENMPGDHRIDLSDERISIKDKISELVDILEKQGSLTFGELFPTDAVKGEIVVTFLAILEMAKLCLIRITQHVQTGVIRLFYL
ncbi:segregation/condensation protein A [Desulfococcaceae bacterium HSG8]|nr:segregation/condensation protein A [Desulfococcaceae bacterium HSG8]